MVHYLSRGEAEMHQKGEEHALASGPVWHVHRRFNRSFETMRAGYRNALEWTLKHRRATGAVFGLFVAASFSLAFVIGRDFFPAVDSGQIRLHVRAPAGTRIEQTERMFAAVEDELRRQIPASELGNILDNIGLP